MKEPKYDNFVVYYPKVNGVWEPSQQTTPEGTTDLGVKRWIMRNFAGAGIKHPQEFFSEARRFLLIPCIASNGISLHCREEA